VYNHSDKHSAFSEANHAWVERCEDELTAAADVVVSSSRALLAADGPRARRAVFLDHGVDLDHFRLDPEGPEPPDMAAIARPRIGFFGGIDDYVVDLDLFERVAREIPEAQLVLIGRVTCSTRRFQDLPNVHWLGQRPYEDIPRYGSAFDVAVMPWLQNDWIAHANPIKLKEYLALGLPVVSTAFPEAEWYRAWIEIARSADEFVALVRESLNGGGRSTPAERRRAVEGCTWTRQAELLMTLCDEVGSEDGPPCAAS
jgi:glycosyltransferase involved in cell wall biosynthesis